MLKGYLRLITKDIRHSAESKAYNRVLLDCFLRHIDPLERLLSTPPPFSALNPFLPSTPGHHTGSTDGVGAGICPTASFGRGGPPLCVRSAGTFNEVVPPPLPFLESGSLSETEEKPSPLLAAGGLEQQFPTTIVWLSDDEVPVFSMNSQQHRKKTASN